MTTILFSTLLGATASATVPACPLAFDADVGDTCLSRLVPHDDPLRLGATLLEYTQTYQRDRIVSELSVRNAAGAEVASIDHTLYVDEDVSTTAPYGNAYDYDIIAQVGRLRGEISPTVDTIHHDPTLDLLGSWLQEQAGVWYLPLLGNVDPEHIDEAACVAACLISCWASGEGHGACGEMCGSICFWLIFTPW